MHKMIPLQSTTFVAPISVTLEASIDTIADQGLDTFAGEHFDHLESVIALEVTRDVVRFTTTRSHAAWRRGEPNAGRGVFELPIASLEAVWLPDA